MHEGELLIFGEWIDAVTNAWVATYCNPTSFCVLLILANFVLLKFAKFNIR